MKVPLALGTISVNSSTNSNLKLKHLSGKLKGSQQKLYRQNMSLLFNQTGLNEGLLPNYIYIYIV